MDTLIGVCVKQLLVTSESVALQGCVLASEYSTVWIMFLHELFSAESFGNLSTVSVAR